MTPLGLPPPPPIRRFCLTCPWRGRMGRTPRLSLSALLLLCSSLSRHPSRARALSDRALSSAPPSPGLEG